MELANGPGGWKSLANKTKSLLFSFLEFYSIKRGASRETIPVESKTRIDNGSRPLFAGRE